MHPQFEEHSSPVRVEGSDREADGDQVDTPVSHREALTELV